MKVSSPERKLALNWRRRHFTVEVLAGLPFVACLIAGAYYSKWFFLVGLLVFGVAFASQRLRFRRCTCETCGAKLQRSMKDGAVIEFFCENCNTIWITNVVQDGEPASS